MPSWTVDRPASLGFAGVESMSGGLTLAGGGRARHMPHPVTLEQVPGECP